MELKDDVLRGGHWIVVLAPSGNLMVVQKQQPRNKRNEVDELLTWVGVRLREVAFAKRFESLLLAKLVLVIKKFAHIEHLFHHDHGVVTAAARGSTTIVFHI